MYTYSQYRTSVLQAEQPLKLQQTVRLRSNATPHKDELTEMGSKGKWEGGDGEGYPGGLNGAGTEN